MNLGGIEVDGLSPDEKRILTLSFYRDAELRGARLLFILLGHLKDGAAQIKMSRQIADETRHALLWTQRLAALRAAPIIVPDGYQRRLGLAVGIPKNPLKLLALTVVVEERAQSRYLAHAASNDVDPATRAVLKTVTQDESWHIAWIQKKLRDTARSFGQQRTADQALNHYRDVERKVWASLMAAEVEMMRA